MQSAIDTSLYRIELLQSLEPACVSATVAKIVQTMGNPAAVGVMLWDPDFESFSEHHKYTFGAMSAELSDYLLELEWDESEFEMDGKDATLIGKDVPEKLSPLLAYKVMRDETPVGLVFVAGAGEFSTDELAENLAHYPLHIALGNSWEVSELKREVERLREQYEQMEFDMQEERRQHAMNGTNGHSVNVRLEQADKEKLVYEISNAVRSSLDIKEVLQTAVNKIGATFSLSRCLVLWPAPDSEEYDVFEYHDDQVPGLQNLFFTPAGERFVRLVQTRIAPHDFCTDDDQEGFDKAFLKNFNFLSGMLVPLIYHDRNIGTLFLQDCMMPREWSIDNTALIGSLADLITVAIEHANMHEEKKRQAVTDGLTGIANRRHFNDTLTKEFERARRYGNPLSLVVVDLDFLKKINDAYGHHVGDEAIKSIGTVLSRSCRSVDLAARYGGEEFCLLLPDTDTEDAVNLAERIRKKIEQTEIEGPGHISASIGVATYPVHSADADSLFEAADQALYKAKEGGRNRVVTATSLPAKH